MWITTGLYLFCALVWALNFFLHWRQDGMIDVSTALFGVSAACFLIAGVLNIVRIRRLKKEDK